MHTEQSGVRPAKIPLVLLLNALVGFFLGLCLMLVASVLIWCEWLPEGLVGGFPAVAAFLSCGFSAYLSGKLLGRGLLFGIVHGLVHYALSYLMGLLVFLRLMPSEWGAGLFLCCIIGGVLGGVLSAMRIRLKKY